MLDLQRIYNWCVLWRIPRVGVKRFSNIIKAFGSPEAFFELSKNNKNNFGINIDTEIIDKAKRGADTDIRWLQDTKSAKIITIEDREYPKQLLNIDDAPPILFVTGNIELLALPQLAIIGSRSPSYEGIENAKNFANFFTQNGIVVTSGLALGIDGEAHKGCLLYDNSPFSGQTIAVMATGPDRVYPAKHRDLAYKILEKGCIVTELPVGTPVAPRLFPRRNRIISGLSLGTLIVEASLKSGSLITARLALEQNREVFAIPGSIHNPLAKGCNHLIRNGAKLVETADDVFDELNTSLLSFVEIKKSDRLNNSSICNQDYFKESINSKNNIKLDLEQQRLWDVLSHDPQPIDILSSRCKIPVNQVSSMLLILELQGSVVKHPGGKYQKKDNGNA